MSNHTWDDMNEFIFDVEAETSPPDDVVSGVTPWKKAIHCILIGMALCSITLNFCNLNYILPAIGMVLSYLGFRTLRRENKWFKICFVITIIRMAYFFSTIALNTTIIHAKVYASPAMQVFAALNIALIFALFLAFGQGIRNVQQHSSLPPHAGGIAALIIWYAILCALALMQYNGIFIAIGMFIAYIFIIRSLYTLSKELDEAGYTITPTPVKMSDGTLVSVIAVFLLVTCLCGYLFGGSYPMNWGMYKSLDNNETKAIRQHLKELGFPENILDDLREEDLAACEGALNVVVDVRDHSVNDGREVTVYREPDPDNMMPHGFVRTTVYDVKELRITGIAVQLPGERETWKIFHHFFWSVNPQFYGTECIQLWPAYKQGNGWSDTGNLTGQVLYDHNGITYIAPYHSLGNKTFTTNNILWGAQTSTDIFATFSMPREGENHRGYISYNIHEIQDGWITDSWINYTHQFSWAQYPAVTAMENRMAGSFNKDGAFITVQDALQFYSNAEGVKLLGAEEFNAH